MRTARGARSSDGSSLQLLARRQFRGGWINGDRTTQEIGNVRAGSCPVGDITGAPMVTLPNQHRRGPTADSQPLGIPCGTWRERSQPSSPSGNQPRLLSAHPAADPVHREFEPIYEPTGCEDPYTALAESRSPEPMRSPSHRARNSTFLCKASSDSAPVVGTWPGRDGGAVLLRVQPGRAEDYRVIVDGSRTALGPEYLVGPIGITSLSMTAAGVRRDHHTGGVRRRAAGRNAHRADRRSACRPRFHSRYRLDALGRDFTYTVTVTGLTVSGPSDRRSIRRSHSLPGAERCDSGGSTPFVVSPLIAASAAEGALTPPRGPPPAPA